MKALNNFLTLLFWILTFGCSFDGKAFAPVNGPTSVTVGEVYTYSVTHTQITDSYWWTSNQNRATVENTYRDGYVYYAEIRWNSAGTDILKLRDQFDNEIGSSGVITISNPPSEPPVGQVSFTMGSNSRCQGSGTGEYRAAASDAIGFSWSLTPSSAGSISPSSSTSTIAFVNWDPSYAGPTATVYVTAHGANSSSSSTSMGVTVIGINQYTVNGPSSICEGASTSVNLSGSQSGASYQLFKNGVPIASAKAGTGSSLTWTAMTQGTYTVTATIGGCSAGMGNPMIIGTTTPGSLTIVPSQASPICQGSTIRLDASGGGPYYEWESTSSEGTGSWENVTFIQVIPNVTTTYYLYGNEPICGFAQSRFVTIAVTPRPDITGEITPTNLTSRCQGPGTTTFGVVASNANSYAWTVTDGAGTVSGSTVTWDPSFSGQATVTVTAYGCNGTTDFATKTIDVTKPSITAGPTSACVNTGGHVYSTQTGMSSYFWSVTGGTITAGQGTSSVTVSWNSAGDQLINVNYTSTAGCTAATPGVRNVTVTALPPTANAGLDQDGMATCGATSVVLAANAPAIGTGSWNIIAGSGGSFGNPSSPTSTFNGAAGISYVLRWTTTNICGQSTDSLRVKFNQTPTPANAGNDKKVSFEDMSTSTTLGAITPTIGTGSWNIVSGSSGSIGNSASPNTPFTGAAGTVYVLQWTVNNSPCPPSADEVTLTFLDGSSENHITVSTALSEGITSSTELEVQPFGSVSETTQYFDGLGRPMQTVTKKGSPDSLDLVQPILYDGFGRESKKYLPFAAQDNGWYKLNTKLVDQATGNYIGLAQSFYGSPTDEIADDPKPYAQTIFESSPLNRVMKQGAAGTSWQPIDANPMSTNDNTVKKRYESNLANEIILFKYNPSTGGIGVSSDPTKKYFPASELSVSKTFDEHNSDVIEYIDKDGRTVCKKVKANATEYACTYYIYDDFGNLVVVLPPEGTKAIANSLSQQ